MIEPNSAIECILDIVLEILQQYFYFDVIIVGVVVA